MAADNYSKVVDWALSNKCQYCDIRIERTNGTSIEVKDGELSKLIPGKEAGASVRVLYGGAWGISSTNDLSKKGLLGATEKALKLARTSSAKKKEKTKLAEVEALRAKSVWKPSKNPHDMSTHDKYLMLLQLEVAARTVKGISSVTTGFSDETLCTSFISSEGAQIESEVTRTMCQINLIGKKDGAIMGFRTRVGGTGGLELFDADPPAVKAVVAAKSLMRVLSAPQSPSGRLPVVADSDLAGVFVHEAVGHATEADLVMAGESVLEGKIGRRIGSDLVNIYDDPTMEFGFGSFPYDDEGVRADKKVLIEKGILRSFIQSRETAHRLGMTPNGGARAESYGDRPIVRMSNTVMGAGDWKLDEIFEDIKYGIYAKGTRGGQVDTTKGSFQFNAQQAFLIEKGEVTKPLRDVSLSGFILETLNEIDAVGNDFAFGEPGYCGKGPQTVPVSDGGPHIRLREAVVGGG